jgi:hypothetical protein
MKTAFVLAAVSSAFLGFSSAASATLLDYQASCTSGQAACNEIGGGTASFKLDQFPTPDHVNGEPFFFSFNAVPGTLNGQSVTFGIAFDELNPGPGGLSLTLGPANKPTLIYGLTGPQLFQGSVNSPELTAGEFPLRGTVVPIGKQFYSFSLVVSPDNSLGSPAPVPEPATWAVMIASLGMMVGARWRSRPGKH